MVTNNRLDLYSVPLPLKTDTYVPVSHQQIIEELLENFDKINMVPVHENYHVNSDGKKVIGYFDFKSSDGELGHRVAFRNSYDKSMSVGFATGGNVWICSNGMLSGDVTYARVHTGNVVPELKQRILSVTASIADEHKLLIKDKERMKQIYVDRTQAAELAGRMFIEDEIINSTQLNIIKREINFSENFTEPSLWSFYNHVTEALKTSRADEYITRHMDLHKFVTKEYAF